MDLGKINKISKIWLHLRFVLSWNNILGDAGLSCNILFC